MIENEQRNETVVDEIQAEAGWVVRHHTQTRTWDERIRLDSFGGHLAEKQAAFDKAERELQEALATKDEVDALAISVKVDLPPVNGVATSTPKM